MPPDQPSPHGRPRAPERVPLDGEAAGPTPGTRRETTDAAEFAFGRRPPDAGPFVAPVPVASGTGPGKPRRRWLDAVLGAEEAAEFRSMGARMRTRLQDLVRLSQPFTASLCVHLLALILLALVVTHVRRDRRRPVDLSFASVRPVEAERPGVQVVEPQAEPDPVPERQATDEREPVIDPMAAPVAAEAETVEALGAEPERPAAPAVGSLLEGREAGRRERLVAAHGGSDATEAAVARALEWLTRQQGKDGLWSLQGPYLDGASQENRLAATAMALLAFQGAGNTPAAGAHRKAVGAAWTALLKRQVAGTPGESDDDRRRTGSGRFVISAQDPPARQALYAHAQATIALCELYGMTKDPALEQPARRAVAYALAAQGPNGGWRYEPGQNGDMSVTGWFMMALKSAQMAGIDVPQTAFAGLARFLDAVAVDAGSRYGYRFDDFALPADADDARLVRRDPGPVTEAVSAEGLLCRQYLGWPRDHPPLARGIEILVANKSLDWDVGKDVYAWYYITQVVHHVGGPAWRRWNDRMRDMLPAEQVSQGREQGSWDPAGDQWGPWGGRLFTTCFCTWMLEVYYRHLPLYGEEALAAAPAVGDAGAR